MSSSLPPPCDYATGDWDEEFHNTKRRRPNKGTSLAQREHRVASDSATGWNQGNEQWACQPESQHTEGLRFYAWAKRPKQRDRELSVCPSKIRETKNNNCSDVREKTKCDWGVRARMPKQGEIQVCFLIYWYAVLCTFIVFVLLSVLILRVKINASTSTAKQVYLWVQTKGTWMFKCVCARAQLHQDILSPGKKSYFAL